MSDAEFRVGAYAGLMSRDIRQTETYRWVQEQYEQMLGPGLGGISNLVDLAVSPDGRTIAGTALTRDAFEGVPKSQIALIDVASGEVTTVTGGSGDLAPQWSVDGSTLTFLSDRVETGVYQLYVLRPSLGEAIAAPVVDGAVEYHRRSPSGRFELLGVAERGADLSGGQGSGTVGGVAKEALPDWMPTVEGATQTVGWRALHVYDHQTNSVRRLSRDGLNVWEAVWLGEEEILAVVSPLPGEELWYTAELVAIDVASGKERTLLSTPIQLGWPAANLSGTRAAVVQAVCSDRYVVAGDVTIIDPVTGDAKVIDTLSVDVTALHWRSDEVLVWAGIRGLNTVVGEHDTSAGDSRELFSTHESCGRFYPEIAVHPEGVVALTLESATRAPAVSVIEGGELRVVASLENEGTQYLTKLCANTSGYSWTAPDGLTIEGVLTLPAGEGPFPLIVNVHGGPVWAYRDNFRLGYDYLPVLVAKGYAVLRPNPRGSSGRGQDFARMVFGEMGGDDTRDFISGVDQLIGDGVVDPARVAVTGGSYGGFMSSWLITQTDRFAASIPIAEVSNWFSQHFTSNIPFFDTIFLGSEVSGSGGHHYTRSPVFLADRVTTPSLHITGALDRCTPAGQAIEFHRALQEAGKHSELVIYPLEGHGVRKFPAVFDFTSRLVDFLAVHCPAQK